jgi:CubicO group peptidase (beta-lactamase class C family)/putative hemolysin
MSAAGSVGRPLLSRATSFRSIALLIGLIGALALAWNVTTDDSPSIKGDRFQRIDAYVTDEMDDSRIPGVSIAIVEGGEIVHVAGYGDDGHGNDITADTPFWIGSNTKSMTALATMQLVEAGLVELDTPVQTYLPEFRVADATASAQITVRHLLNQTSGIARIDGIRAVVDADGGTLAEVVAGMDDLELNRPVGESFEYANLNSVVLGLLIERVTGQTWQAYVQDNIFEPLGMSRTFTSHSLAQQHGLTATYRHTFGIPMGTDGTHLDGLAPSGYVYSTASDMGRYLAMYTRGGALDGNQVLDPSGVAQMLAPATNERSFVLQSQRFTAQYGAGWFVGPFGDADDARWHQGSLPHFTAWMVVLPDSDQAVVVLINSGSQFELGGANSAWSRIPQGIVNLLLGRAPPTGISASRFYIVFDTLVVLAVVGQVRTLAGVALRRRAARQKSTVRQAAPLGWELVGAPLVLIGYPAVTGGLGWGAAFTFVPDLSLSVLAIAGLAVLSGVVRAVRLVQANARRASGSDDTGIAGHAAVNPGHDRDVAAMATVRLAFQPSTTRRSSVMRSRSRQMTTMVVLSITLLAGCGDDSEPTDTTTPAGGIANPASEFCVAQGGTVEIVDEAGGQVGYCNLPDGSRVEEWEYFRTQTGATTEP